MQNTFLHAHPEVPTPISARFTIHLAKIINKLLPTFPGNDWRSFDACCECQPLSHNSHDMLQGTESTLDAYIVPTVLQMLIYVSHQDIPYCREGLML